ncbi:M23 family metallopeptidase [Clostridium frigidicarnis]|uniref:Peptidase family M23 n=1 Tax=Clostridium frigidicarnis TaxID=84698 RepID=A0A1I1A4S9_9CLOT|nr:M23 family metallopeptidase [Clostridium frigidicarnis]SFB33034.1 Peptidase family M23 [Clostridium frigidicarnis]
MKKKVGLVILLLIEIICIIGVYVVGGQVSPWIWSGCIFIIAPIASIALVVQIVIGVVRGCKRKNIKWNMLYIIITLIMAYPITILFGISILTYPANLSDKETIEIINPVEDSILLGGKDYKIHAVWPSECYAYDIVKEPYDINSDKLSDYGIYQANVYCPISGTVIYSKDTEEDILPNTEDFQSSLGNYIFIKVEETGTYLVLAHLEKNSVNVSIGEHVTQGTILAKVGNSGTTSEPHLHVQHQKNNPIDMKIPICSEGLPIKFVENN